MSEPFKLFLNETMCKIMRKLQLCQMNRNWYNPREAVQIPAHKLEIWPGYVTRVDEYEGGLMLQCDISHRVLRQDTALDFLRGLARRAKAQNLDFQDLAKKELLNSIVLTR